MAILAPYKGKFRLSSIQGPRWGTTHNGHDYVGQDSKTVYSICNGTVEFVGWQNGNSSWSWKSIGGGSYNTQGTGYGYHVILRCAKTQKQLFYGHLKGGSGLVKVGQVVTVGTPIGEEGNTGNSTGSHLHFEIRPVVNYSSTPSYTNVPNSIGTYTSDIETSAGSGSAFSVPVHLLTGNEAAEAGVVGGRHTLIDLKTMTQYDVCLGWTPSNGYHVDFTPIGPDDVEQMYKNAGGWNWTGRPCVLKGKGKAQGKLFAVGIHSRPHNIIIGDSEYPISRKLGKGITNRNDTGPPWAEWGGHMCMYFKNSPGGTNGARQAAFEAYELANSMSLSDISGGTTYQPLYTTHNTREDGTMREVGILDYQYKPSINTDITSPRLSVVNYTSMLSLMFSKSNASDVSFENTFDGDIEAEAMRNAKRIHSFFKTKLGLSNNNIAGILGNWYHESHIDQTSIETIYNEPFSVAGSRKQAAIQAGYRMAIMNPAYKRRFPAIDLCGIGLGQWTNGRNAMLRDFAKKIGKDWWQLETQLQFCITPQNEGGDSQWTVSWLCGWQSESSPDSAATAFLKRWEGMVESTWGIVNASGRQAAARRWVQEMTLWV